ncbi:MAG: hypothetical protein AAF266_04890 [Planctomycetota bacterium]
MFATYDQHGVSLAYPENWTLEEETDAEARVTLTIASPNTAFWTLVVYAETLDLEHAVEQAIDALKGEYPEIETAPAKEKIGDTELTGQDTNFFLLELTNTARVRACHRGGSTYLILCQSEDRELERVSDVFQAITQSLLSNTPIDAD